MPVSELYAPDPMHRTLGPLFYDMVEPARFPKAVLRYRNQAWAERVGLGALSADEWIAHFARFEPLPGNLTAPLALRYHGHQFQAYNPDLGDGRGFLFAQLRDPEDGRLLDLGTKGSGRTPWSRSGDGRLTLKGAVREVLATEMLEALGCTTSKTFSVIETGEALERGDEPSPTRSAVLVRLNHSHVRIGTFQRLAAHGETDALRALVDYCVAQYHPEAAAAADPTAAFFAATAEAVARMGAEWMCAGFVHGVLNTDNTLITGESFDYGPWRFAPTYDPRLTAAYFDHSGLYAFGRQPNALGWNLARLGECLLELTDREALEAGLARFGAAFEDAIAAHLHRRLGIARAEERAADPKGEDGALVEAVFRALMETEAPLERAMFDLAGGAAAERLAASPIRETYEAPAMAAAIALLRARTPAVGAAAALAAGPPAPATKLWDEVEAIWARIAEADDWSAFEAKISEIRAYGAVQRAFGPAQLRARAA
ncbi:MAG: YdiU family protein [Pseudomonadota bacterium]